LVLTANGIDATHPNRASRVIEREHDDMTRLVIVALATFGVVLAIGPSARAQNTSCSTTMTGAVVNGNLVVPTGATCTLTNVTVTGNVLVGKGATLYILTTGTIHGNIQGNRCNQVLLEALQGTSFVGGNLQIENCTGTGESGYFVRAPGSITIEGNFQCQNNNASCVADGGIVLGNVQDNNNNGEAIVDEATIQSNLQVSGNAGGPRAGAFVVGDKVMGNVQINGNSGTGANIIGGNVIDGNLQCASNTPGVTDGGAPNTVQGNKQGQCAGL
jgi:hypothetical protein